jgi:glucose-1-phosphate thymidylyltransferase
MIDASSFIATIEKRQGLRVACLEEIAFLMGHITKEQFLTLARASNDLYLKEKAQVI